MKNSASSAARPGRWRESLSLLSLFLPGARRKSIYDILSTHNLLAERSLFLNLGDWREAESYDAACAALARRLLAGAPPDPGDIILDVGCGFGDAARLWMDEFSPASIVSIGRNPAQLRTAASGIRERSRIRERGRVGLTGLTGHMGRLWGRLCVARVDAVALAFRSGAFQRVLALESAFHFHPRGDFFREAHRVLAPGGSLAIADLVPFTDPSHWSAARRILFRLGASLWQFPSGNLRPAADYAGDLRDAGFTDVRWESIGADVFPGFKAYSRKRLDEPEIRLRLNPLLRRIWRARAHGRSGDGLDYVLFYARKPA